jgi:hypothetical protein
MRKLAPALVLLLGLTGCATGTAQPGAPAPAPVPTATSPGCPAEVTVTDVDAGATRCVALSGTLAVLLTQDWAPAQLSAPGVLVAQPVTGSGPGPVDRRYLAVGTGTVDITSSRSACPPPSPGSAGCHAQQGWRITVTVR